MKEIIHMMYYYNNDEPKVSSNIILDPTICKCEAKSPMGCYHSSYWVHRYGRSIQSCLLHQANRGFKKQDIELVYDGEEQTEYF